VSLRLSIGYELLLISLFLLCAFAHITCCNFLFLSFQVFIVTNIFLIYTTDSCNVTFIYSNMPVITRSQAKDSIGSFSELLETSSTTISIGSSSGLLVLPSSDESIDSSKEFLTTNASAIGSPDGLLQNTNDFPITTSSAALDSAVSQDASLLLDPTSHLAVSNLEILNSENFENKFLPSMVDLLPAPSQNLSVSKITQMEGDCDDIPTPTTMSTEMTEIGKFLALFSVQMTTHMDRLQDQLIKNDQKISQSQESFKQEVHDEIEQLRQFMITKDQSTVIPGMSLLDNSAPASIPAVSSSSSSNPIADGTHSPTHYVNSNTGMRQVDIQSQMMLMLMESFSKLSTVLADKSQDVKSEVKTDWPKFSGDVKKFKSWYLSIVAQLSIPHWQEFYDQATNSIVSSTTNTTLNGKLYAKLLASLEGQALQDMVSRSHVHANGILLLRELVQTYRPCKVPEVPAVKAGEFWSKMKRGQNESIDSYFNHFQELLEDLNEADDKISTSSAMRQFIFTLGNDFKPIQNLYCIDNLPSAWKTTSWPSLLVLCHDFYNSINQKGNTSKDLTNISDYNTRMAQQKKVKEWFLHPAKFCKEIEREQKKYPDMCIFYLSKSHATENCYLKKECDKNKLQTKDSIGKSSVQSGSGVGQLRHVTEEFYEDAVSTDLVEETQDESNDTNEAGLLYFARMTNHYLRLVKASKEIDIRHSMQYPVIADSGANFHMFRDQAFFINMTPATGRVLLGDGKTALNIQGVGTVHCTIDGHDLILDNVRYVPDLSESIYSLFLHIKFPGHSLKSSFENGLLIGFPDFETKALVGEHDIYIEALPKFPTAMNDHPSINSSQLLDTPSSICRNLKEFQSQLQDETTYLDNLLQELRHYYETVKTRRQLNLEVPAGFQKVSDHNKLLRDHLSLNAELDKSFSSSELSELLPSDEIINTTEISPENTNLSSSHSISPIIPSVDKVSSSLPKVITMSEDFVRASMGFRRIDTIKQHFSELYENTIKFDPLPPDTVLDLGDMATLRKTPRNTTPVPRPLLFGDVIHCDIVFGPEVAIGNVHYGLMFTDRFSRMNYMYPLQNLTSDIKKQIEAFFVHIGSFPRRLITDFDLKLIGGKAREYLNSLLIHVNATLAYCQDRNRLAERHWQTMVMMARNWLASAELPATFWFFAVKRAAEVSNYFPYKLEDGTFITPFELVHKKKPDLRVLFKMFGLATVLFKPLFGRRACYTHAEVNFSTMSILGQRRGCSLSGITKLV
jgi:hypothetical protein